jgi:hypothetical protein
MIMAQFDKLGNMGDVLSKRYKIMIAAREMVINSLRVIEDCSIGPGDTGSAESVNIDKKE